MVFQELNNFLCIFYMAVKAQAQSFCSLKKNPCIERRNTCTLVAKKDSADICYKSLSSCSVCKADSVIAWVCFCNVFVFSGKLPVKVSAVYNDAAKRRSVTADKLCSRVNNYVCTVFKRAEKIWSSESVVHNNRKSVFFCNCRKSIKVWNI